MQTVEQHGPPLAGRGAFVISITVPPIRGSASAPRSRRKGIDAVMHDAPDVAQHGVVIGQAWRSDRRKGGEPVMKAMR